MSLYALCMWPSQVERAGGQAQEFLFASFCLCLTAEFGKSPAVIWRSADVASSAPLPLCSSLSGTHMISISTGQDADTQGWICPLCCVCTENYELTVYVVTGLLGVNAGSCCKKRRLYIHISTRHDMIFSSAQSTSGLTRCLHFSREV